MEKEVTTRHFAKKRREESKRFGKWEWVPFFGLQPRGWRRWGYKTTRKS